MTVVVDGVVYSWDGPLTEETTIRVVRSGVASSMPFFRLVTMTNGSILAAFAAQGAI